MASNQSVTRPEFYDRVRVREFKVGGLGGESGSETFLISFQLPIPSAGFSSRKQRVRDQNLRKSVSLIIMFTLILFSAKDDVKYVPSQPLGTCGCC